MLKKFGLLSSLKGVGHIGMVFFIASIFLLAACDDESSFAPRDEDSSSSVCEDCDESSSSVILSGDSHEGSYSSSEKSSSSRENDKSSSSEKIKSSSSNKVVSSSSEKQESSSSSSVKQSSSSIASSSSSVKSSSSSVKSSSSVVSSSSKDVASSSSEYVPFDHTVTLGAMRDEYKTFVDERNGRSYYYITIRGKNSKGEADSVTVMAENLNIGKMIYYDDYQTDDSQIERFCYNDDTTNCDRYGGLYQWAEMMQLPNDCNTKSCADLIHPNHQGICPDGWRLLTQEDFYIVLHADGNTHGIAGVRSSYGFNGFNSTGYSLVGAGYVWNRKLTRIGEATYWYYPEEGSYSEDGEVISTAFVASTSRSGEYLSEQETLKTQGLSVRCVKMD